MAMSMGREAEDPRQRVRPWPADFSREDLLAVTTSDRSRWVGSQLRDDMPEAGPRGNPGSVMASENQAKVAWRAIAPSLVGKT